MKRIAFLLLFALFLVGCGPSEEQIQAAIEQTEKAKPTNTVTPEPTPTITPTPTAEPTATPSYKYMKGISSADMVNLFLSVGIMCGEKEISGDGSYEQPCSWPIDGGLLQAKITGNSEETVASFRVMLVPFTGEDMKEQAIDIFLGLTEFSSESEEINSWIMEEIDGVMYSDSETSKTLEISGLYLMLIGQKGIIGLFVMASN